MLTAGLATPWPNAYFLGGLGWDVSTFVALEHMVDATQQLGLGWGWDVITFVALEHMVDATQQLGLGRGGMFQPSLHLNTWLMLPNSWGWGEVGCFNLRCTWTHGWCYPTVGVGARWDVSTFVALEHMVDATQQLGLGRGGMFQPSLHLNTWLMLPNSWGWGEVGCFNLRCTWTHGWCYPTVGVGARWDVSTFVALEHMVDATQQLGLGRGGMFQPSLHLNTRLMLPNSWGWGEVGCFNLRCTWTHGWCYPTVGVGARWDVSTFVALEHMVDATQQLGLGRGGMFQPSLHLNTWLMLPNSWGWGEVGCFNLRCTWTHGWCYPTVGVGARWDVSTFVALEHMVDATQQLGLGRGGMFQPSLHLNTWLMLPNSWGWGEVGCFNLRCTWTHGWCYPTVGVGARWDVSTFVALEHMVDATQQLGLGRGGMFQPSLHLNTWLMLPNSWGWGEVGCFNLRCTWTHGWCYPTVGVGAWWDVLTFVALEHMVDATQQLGLGQGGMFQPSLHLNTWLMLPNSWGWGVVGCFNLRCTWTHGWCYPTVGVGARWDVSTFVALEHMVDATQQLGLGRGGMFQPSLHLNTWLMLLNSWGWGEVGCFNLRCTWTHGWCYPTVGVGARWDVSTFVALEHMVDATQQLGLGRGGMLQPSLHLNTWLMLPNSWGWGEVGCFNLRCTWTHGWCYPTVGVGAGCDVSTFVALEHMVDATQQLGLGRGGMFQPSLHLNTWLMLPNSWGWGGVGCFNLRCTWTHGWCYPTVGVGARWDVSTFVALEHMVDATQQLGLGRGGMFQPSLHLNTWLMLPNSWGWAVVGCFNLRCTWTHGWCYPTVGVGARWDVSTFVALEHMVDATQQLGLGRGGMFQPSLHLNTWLMLPNSWGWGEVGCFNLRCTWTHGWCYPTVGVGAGWDVSTFVALEHMVDATQQLGLGRGGMFQPSLHLNTWLMLPNSWGWGGVGCFNLRCTWTHGWCYPTVGVGAGWDVSTFVALEHMVDATQQLGLGWDDMC